ncbi:MAG TPA: wax ester/triacylglycerol synthase family O-acyltransferase [Acidimicrobiales bacterium]
MPTHAIRFDSRMSDSDALMWTIESDPVLRSTIIAVAVFDTEPDRARLIERMERGSRLVPRLRQRVVGSPLSLAPPRWEFDPNFDLSYHLRFWRAPEGGTLHDVLRLAAPMAMQGFDRARPLWEMVVVDGLAEGRSGMILKLHHAITDGVGAVKIAAVLFDFEREPGQAQEPTPDPPPVHVMNRLERFRDAFEHERRRQAGILDRALPNLISGAASFVQDPVGRARRSAEVAGSVVRMLAPANAPLSPIMTGRSLSVNFEVLSLPLAEAKAVAKAAGTRLNDFFLAAVLGGLRRYHEQHHAAPARLRTSMPINIRDEQTGDVAGNRFAPARFTVPLQIKDPTERMKVVHALVGQVRAEPALALVDPLALVLRRAPAFVATGLFGSLLRSVDVITSNVPGIPVPIYLAGAQMLSQFPFGPRSGAAINITLLSYLDQIHVGVNTDPAAVPDQAVFAACLTDGFDELLKLA